MTSNVHPTREAWLTAGVELIRPWFVELGKPLVSPVRATIGFPSRGALSQKRRRIGECWAIDASADGTAEILISPVLDDPVEILATLTHEVGHAVLGPKVGHRRPFAKLMTDLQLEGKATATFAGPAFRERATPILSELGPLPHARLTALLRERKPADSCRQLKVTCPTCGYLARVTKKWLELAGGPICPVDQVPLELDDAEGES